MIAFADASHISLAVGETEDE